MNLRTTPIFAESWSVAYRRKTPGSILSDRETPFSVIPNDPHYWAADPMVFQHDGKTYIFAELYDYSLFRGIIGVSEFDGEKFGKWTPVLTEPTHLSYPFLFRLGDEICMIPENRYGHVLSVYRAVDFPYTWERCKIIRDDVEWVDTTLIPDGKEFWGYTESMTQPMTDLRLRLDSELNLLSCEPVRDGADNCHRCGGPMFMHEGKLVWVTQDCVEDYGQALFFRFCDPKTGQEESVVRLTPHQLRLDQRLSLDGMHTYSAAGDFEVIDLKTRRLVWRNFYYRLTGKIRWYLRRTAAHLRRKT